MLQEKKSVLKQLVNMNLSELASRGENCYGIGGGRNNGSNIHSYYTQSNTSSIASHATFASGSSNNSNYGSKSGIHRVANTSRSRNIAIPKLNMNSMRK